MSLIKMVVSSKGLKILLVAVTVFVAVMGFAHTRAGRPLLVMIENAFGKPESCPLGYGNAVSDDDRAKFRSRMAAERTALPKAGNTRLMGFDFGNAQRSDVQSFIAKRGGHCNASSQSARESECEGPFYGSVGSTLWFEYDKADRLVSMKGVETFLSPQRAKSLFKNVRQQVTKKGNQGISEDSIRNLRHLESGLLRQTQIAADFRNLRAVASVTNMGDHFVVTQEFMIF